MPAIEVEGGLIVTYRMFEDSAGAAAVFELAASHTVRNPADVQ